MPASQRPNVIFITCDQLRSDTLGCYGHPVVETPHLDQLAGKGVRFTQAYSAVASCIAARAAILTGMAQNRHGRVGYKDRVPFQYPHTLPGELAKLPAVRQIGIRRISRMKDRAWMLFIVASTCRIARICFKSCMFYNIIKKFPEVK